MDKKLLSVTLSAAIVALAASCSSEDIANNSGDKVPVQFKVSANSALATRAIGDGSTVDQLSFHVFDKNGNIINDLTKTETANDLLSGHTVTLMLAKGQTYKIAFWAQKSGVSYYTFDDKTVTVNYTGANNAEDRDAFFGVTELTVSGDAQQDVTLKRPFAQVNVGSSEEDWTNAQKSGITIAKSKVEIKGLANSLNLLDGTVSGATDATFELGDIPAGTFSTDADGDGMKETYHYLSTTYVLPAEATASSTATASYIFQPASGDNIELSQGLENMPVQRNYRTNIVGQILTNQADFKVTVDANFDDDYNSLQFASVNGKQYGSLDEALKAIAADGTAAEPYTVQINNDATLPATAEEGQNVVTIGNANTTVNLDLGGKTITLDVGTGNGANGGVVIKSEGTVNITNGTLVVKKDPSYSGYALNNDGILIDGKANLTNVSADNDVAFTDDVVADGCTFNGGTLNPMPGMTLPVTVSGAGKKAEFKNCTFGNSYIALGIADVVLENDNPVDAIFGGLTIDNCRFNFTSKAHHVIYFLSTRDTFQDQTLSSYTKYPVSITNCEFRHAVKPDDNNYIYQTNNGLQEITCSNNKVYLNGVLQENLDDYGKVKQ